MNTSPLYRHSRQVPWASRVSEVARARIFAEFCAWATPAPTDLVLDVGVTSDEQHPESNFFERLFPYKDRLTCVGTEDGAHLERQYAGIRFIRVSPGERLPFADQHFDIVFSNAVIEHVGGPEAIRAFAAELCRVGKRVFVATPNRWFPVEHHTGLPLLHYLPRPWFRQLLRPTPMSYWSFEEHLNVLGPRDLAAAFSPARKVRIQHVGIGLGAFRSNLVACVSR